VKRALIFLFLNKYASANDFTENNQVNRLMYKSRFVAALTLTLFVNNNVFADLIFSAPPRGTETVERETYEPLVKAMSKAIGEKVQYVYPRDFNEYSFDMQKGRYDIVFDGPHFSQWRVVNLNHTILVNLPENLQFLVVTPVGETNVNTLNDLVFESVCAQWTPQLGTLMLLENFYERMAEPNLHLVHGEDKVYSDFARGACTAAVLRDKTFFKMSIPQRADYKVVYKSPIAPNDAITVATKISQKQRKALIALLTDPRTAKVARPIFDRFSKNAAAFKLADPAQFEGLDQLLLLAFGWRKR
jgi:ABC-type phosphate/phosphonate transport system substrate-binding protein